MSYNVCSRNSHLVERHKAIILAVVSKLWTDIAHLNTLNGFPVFVSSSNHKWLDSVALAINNEFGIDNCVVAEMSHISRPVLGC